MRAEQTLHLISALTEHAVASAIAEVDAELQPILQRTLVLNASQRWSIERLTVCTTLCGSCVSGGGLSSGPAAPLTHSLTHSRLLAILHAHSASLCLSLSCALDRTERAWRGDQRRRQSTRVGSERIRDAPQQAAAPERQPR